MNLELYLETWNTRKTHTAATNTPVVASTARPHLKVHIDQSDFAELLQQPINVRSFTKRPIVGHEGRGETHICFLHSNATFGCLISFRQNLISLKQFITKTAAGQRRDGTADDSEEDEAEGAGDETVDVVSCL